MKSMISMRYWLLGRNYHAAIEAMEFASKFHTGFRKDNCTPEFEHQLSIASFVRTLTNELQRPEQTLAVAFLHDVCEDYPVSLEEIESKFGEEIRDAVDCLTKKESMSHMSVDKYKYESYYTKIANNKIASIVKGADRMHNIQSMHGVFCLDKQEKYVKETNDYVLPMLKSARRTFVSQEPAYENIKHVLKSQIDLILAIHNGLKK